MAAEPQGQSAQPSPDKWAQYAQSAQPAQPASAGDKWAQYATSTPAAAPQPSLLQRAKANFNAGTQAPPPPTSILDELSPKRALQSFGAGAGDAVRGVYHMFDKPTGPPPTLDQQYDQAGKQVHSFLNDPVGSYAHAAGEAAPALIAGAAGKSILDAVPSRVHAISVLNDVERAAKDVPVAMENTKPALEQFQGSVRTGGKNAPVMQQLRNRITPRPPRVSILEGMQQDLSGEPIKPVDKSPILFPEARDFYSNVSKVTAKPGMLRRAFESPREAPFRAVAGPVRGALNDDLIDAAGQVGRADDYANAMREYRNNARLRKVAKAGAGIGAGYALRDTPLLRGITSKFIPTN